MQGFGGITGGTMRFVNRRSDEWQAQVTGHE
jgi:hypothetical protein